MTKALCVSVLLGAVLLVGCFAVPTVKPEAGPPQVSEVDADAIWVVREVVVPRGDDVQRLYGLFACYRRPATDPGPPQCYLAKTSWSEEDLAWPGVLELRGGQLVKIHED